MKTKKDKEYLRQIDAKIEELYLNLKIAQLMGPQGKILLEINKKLSEI